MKKMKTFQVAVWNFKLGYLTLLTGQKLDPVK